MILPLTLVIRVHGPDGYGEIGECCLGALTACSCDKIGHLMRSGAVWRKVSELCYSTQENQGSV